MDINTNFSVNGSKVQKKVKIEETLQDFLRNTLKLTGVKKGCSNEDCGSCTVLINGKPHWGFLKQDSLLFLL